MKIKKAHVILNGLKWSTTALEVYGQTYFTYRQAIDILNGSNRRIPTKEEFEELIKLPKLWDYKKNGIWFAEKKKLLKTDQSLFLPFLGYKNPYRYDIIDETNSFQFWGSGRDSQIRNSFFYFCGARDHVAKGYIRNDYQFTVRCVKDLE